jgi:Ran GTPase-activating protein (RanGAP) involved in mRNA processing and transport
MAIADMLMHNNTLRSLHLSKNSEADVDSSELVSAIHHHPTITELCLWGFEFQPSGVAQLLGPESKLIHLEVCISSLNCQGVVNSFSFNSTLTNLKFSHIKKNAFVILPPYPLGRSMNRIKKLDFSNCHFCFLGRRSLFNALRQCRSITNLNLNGTYYLDFGYEQTMADFLATNSTLQILNLSANIVDNDSMTAIARALTSNHNSVLRELDLSNNNIKQASVIEIINMLASNPTITKLDLSGNAIEPASVAAINQTLQQRRATCVDSLDDQWHRPHFDF